MPALIDLNSKSYKRPDTRARTTLQPLANQGDCGSNHAYGDLGYRFAPNENWVVANRRAGRMLWLSGEL